MSSDPVSVLEHALALLELYECNSSDIDLTVEDDDKFIKTCFDSKRCNGWISVVGDVNRDDLAEKINDRWKFQFFGSSKATGIYTLLNMLARYSFVYGRIAFGDAHALSHFVEDHCPGLMIVWGELTDLELTLSLAALNLSFAHGSSPDPGRIGGALLAFTRHEFPRLNRIKVEIIFEERVVRGQQGSHPAHPWPYEPNLPPFLG